MTVILSGQIELAYFRNLLVIYFVQNYHSKVKFKAKNVLLEVGV